MKASIKERLAVQHYGSSNVVVRPAPSAQPCEASACAASSSIATPPAADADSISEAEVRAISAQLNEQMVVMGTTSWFKLFRLIDADGSGLISFDEVQHMIRKDLKISESEINDAKIQDRASEEAEERIKAQRRSSVRLEPLLRAHPPMPTPDVLLG